MCLVLAQWQCPNRKHSANISIRSQKHVPVDSYLILAECVWHSPCIASNLDIDSSKSLEDAINRALQLFIRTWRRQAHETSVRAFSMMSSSTYFATNTQAAGGNRACALSLVTTTPLITVGTRPAFLRATSLASPSSVSSSVKLGQAPTAGSYLLDMKSALPSSPRQVIASRMSRVRLALGEELAELPDWLPEAVYFTSAPCPVDEAMPEPVATPLAMMPCTMPPDERRERESIAGSGES
jgi:hypothetical protein